MIVTGHLLCRGRGGGTLGGFYIMIIQIHALLGLGTCSSKKLKKNSVISCVFVYIWIRFFVLNNF